MHSNTHSKKVIWTQTRPTVIENHYRWMGDSLAGSDYGCEKGCVHPGLSS
jgi:hypothetical protein